MLQEHENSSNRIEHSKPLFRHTNDVISVPTFAVWKRALLLAIGLVGLNMVAIFLTFFFLGLPENDQIAAVQYTSYSIIFLAMIGVVFTDIPKYKRIFMTWRPYFYGLLLGIFIILFDNFYFQFINLFYPIDVGSNETAIRSVIDLYPAVAIIILGLVGPLCEEFAYRVGLFGLLRRVNIILAYAATGLVFGFLHFGFDNPNIALEFIILPSYVISGVIFSFGYDLFGLPCSYTAHAVNNLWAVIVHIIQVNS